MPHSLNKFTYKLVILNRQYGYGQVIRVSVPSMNCPGIEELKSQNAVPAVNLEQGQRQRKIGGGRKSLDNEMPEVLKKLESLIKPYEL